MCSRDEFVVLRGEDPPADAVVVIRGGVNGLAVDTVTRAASRGAKAVGFLGVSVTSSSPTSSSVLLPDRDQVVRIRRVDGDVRLHLAVG